jgi:hypothetical protein
MAVQQLPPAAFKDGGSRDERLAAEARLVQALEPSWNRAKRLSCCRVR